MTRMVINFPTHEAKILIKLAFEHTERISTYLDKGQMIVGKTGPYGSSHGEVVTVYIQSGQVEGKTPVEIESEKVTPLNITSNPEEIEAEFINYLADGMDYDIDYLVEINSHITHETTKEVRSPKDQANWVNKVKEMLS